MAVDVQRAVATAEDEINTDMNVVPLTDVMLVLLIIFLVTIPVALQVVPVELPTYRNIVSQTKPENIVISVDANENVYYNTQPISQQAMVEKFVAALKSAAAEGKPLPEVHIRGDKAVRFEAIGRVILACQQAGIQKVGFITQPRPLDAGSY